jgi:drug/metabolite transporter (DMT)-like permease
VSAPGADRAAPSAVLVWSALGVVYVVWGSTYLAIRVMVEDIPPLLGAGARFAIAGVVMLAVLAALGRRCALDRRTAAGAAVVGLLLPAGGNGLVTVAEQDVPSGLASLLIATVPLWVVVLRLAVGRERVAPASIAAVVLGFAGVAVLLAPGARPAGAATTGVLLCLVAAASWATGSFLAPRLALPEDGLVSTGWQMVFGGAGLLVGAVLAGEPGELDLGATSGDSLLAFAFLVVFGSWLAYAVYGWLLQHAPISQVATYAYVNPVVAVFLGWAVLDEVVRSGAAVGAAIVVASVALTVTVESGVRRRAARTASRARPASGSG